MQAKVLQPEDKNRLVKQLYDYSPRAINQKVKARYAEKTGMSESTFRDKMLGTRFFRGYELDVVESLYAEALGQETFDTQVKLFLTKAADGDARTNEAAQDEAIADLAAQNEEMVLGKVLV